ncbi:hypothetical protein MXB_3803 [Myxobolus squamalis]|nr:hypothetical protein MXB_3803 [Myxobolus squamalis]
MAKSETEIRPRCFFDISINGTPAGRVVFELFYDVCSKTCENFRSLCTGERGESSRSGRPLHYKGSLFHRVIKEFMIQGGDFEKGNGTGGESIYGDSFEDEDFTLDHDEPFLLSMANKGPNTNGSQFFITTSLCPHLNGKHVVFGRVVSGQRIIADIENQRVDQTYKPYADIRIEHSGELIKKSVALQLANEKGPIDLSKPQFPPIESSGEDVDVSSVSEGEISEADQAESVTSQNLTKEAYM